LPAKRYVAAVSKRTTDRYFVDKFPMFFEPRSPVVNFTFIDLGWENLKSFENHLFVYGSLFRVLQDVRLTYMATRCRRFEAGQKMFFSMVEQVPKIDPGDEVLRYFRLRKAWEAKKYELFSNDDIELLNKFTQQFAKHPCVEHYPAWRDDEVSDDFIRSLCRDLTPAREVRFQTELLDGQAALFEAKPRRGSETDLRKLVNNEADSSFRPLFSSDFGGEQKEIQED